MRPGSLTSEFETGFFDRCIAPEHPWLISKPALNSLGGVLTEPPFVNSKLVLNSLGGFPDVNEARGTPPVNSKPVFETDVLPRNPPSEFKAGFEFTRGGSHRTPPSEFKTGFE